MSIAGPTAWDGAAGVGAAGHYPRPVTLSRRRFLLAGGALAAAGAGALALVETGSLPGKTRLDAVLHPSPPPVGAPPDPAGPLVEGSFTSVARRGRTVGWTVAYPPGREEDAALPVCLALPGRGGDHASVFRDFGIEHWLAAIIGSGARPFAIASVDGGESTYWHKRSDGDDPAAMLTDEFLPLLAGRGLLVDRVAFIGWSMGGYGAIRFAERMGPSRVAAVVGSSPALWHMGSETPAGAFDGAADFEANDVFRERANLAGVAVRIDCGAQDPFVDAAHDFAMGVPGAQWSSTQGGHDAGYWSTMLPAQLRFVSEHLPP